MCVQIRLELGRVARNAAMVRARRHAAPAPAVRRKPSARALSPRQRRWATCSTSEPLL
jgi:hypothetical protein